MSSTTTTTSTNKRKTATTIKKIQLHLMKKGLGLPSMDPNGMAVLTYCKMIDRKVHIIEDNISGTAKLQFLSPPNKTHHHKNSKKDQQHDDDNDARTTYYGAYHVIEQMKEIQPQFDIDSWLGSKKKKAKMIAAQHMIVNQLLPCVQHYMWLNELNYEHTKEEYCEGLPLLKRWFGPYLVRKTMNQSVNEQLLNSDLSASVISCLESDDDDGDDGGANVAHMSTTTMTQLAKKTRKQLFREEIFAIATKCISIVNTLLYGKKFLFSNDKPCSLDAILYGCLACIYYPDDYQDSAIKNKLKSYVYVINYIHSMTDMYFPHYPSMKQQHLSGAPMTVQQIKLQRIRASTAYSRSLIFLAGSFLAVTINLFPGWMRLYILLRQGEFSLEPSEDDNYQYELVYEEEDEEI